MRNKIVSNQDIFKQSSTTFYYSSIFFPRKIRKDVFTLYAYVRTADNYVDKTPADKAGFMEYYKNTHRALNRKVVSDSRIMNLITLLEQTRCDPTWIKGFLEAMKSDLSGVHYHSYKDLRKYMYGSAEVIGLCLCRIFNLSPEANESARAQGEAMQLINFIRDIAEDHALNRQYIPQEDCDRFKVHVPPLPGEEKQFIQLIRFEINRYKKIQQKAQSGYHYLPRRYRFVVKTASDMYMWTANKIEANPLIVLHQKIRPPKHWVMIKAFMNAFSAYIL